MHACMLYFPENWKGMTLAAVVVMAAVVVVAALTALIYISKKADTREGWLVEAVAVMEGGAGVHYGLNLHEIDE